MGEGVVERFKERLQWSDPLSVGTARVLHVEHPRHDMIFIDCGGEDVTAEEFVFTPPGQIVEGQIVEVIVQTRQLKKPFKFPGCRVAVRPFRPETYGRITPDDRKVLAPMFDYPDNQKDTFYSRAFYRRFFPGAADILRPFPNPSESGPHK